MLWYYSYVYVYIFRQCVLGTLNLNKTLFIIKTEQDKTDYKDDMKWVLSFCIYSYTLHTYRDEMINSEYLKQK